jgi:hypothetical protein
LPTLTAITGLLAAGIIGATKEGGVRSALLFGLTTGYGIIIAKALDAKEVHRTVESWANGFLHLLAFGLNKIFGGNVVKDAFGASFLALTAKVALLFKAGREFFGKGLLGFATSPTKGVRAINDAFDIGKLNRGIAKTDYALRDPNLKESKVLEAELKTAQSHFVTSIETLSREIDSNGKILGRARAENLVLRGDAHASKILGGTNSQYQAAAQAR